MKLKKNSLSSNKIKIRISKEASIEINDTILWYELHQKGLGKEFYKCLLKAFKNILYYPESYQIAFVNVRRCIIRKFPVSIFYKIDTKENEIIIGAVYHNSRDLEGLEKRKY